ncbi:MAG: DUF4296 domain-containing protein [Bacteroidota bacterium]
MKIFFPCLCIICIFISCRNNQQIPKTIIEKDSMVLILNDIQIIEAGLGIAHNNGVKESNYIVPFYKKVIEKHKQSSERFILSLEYYCQNPRLLDESYQKLLPILIEKQTIFNNKKQ